MIIKTGENIYRRFAEELENPDGQKLERDGLYGMKLVSHKGTLSTRLVRGEDLEVTAFAREYVYYNDALSTVALKDFEIIGPFKHLDLMRGSN